MLAVGIITYTDTQASALQALHPRKQIGAAPNALYHQSHFGFDNGVRDNFIYVGRLARGKKPELLIRAFKEASTRISAHLTIVGDGELSEALVTLVSDLGLSARVTFAGFIEDAERLRTLYSRSVASISPGYVGLSATQSISFGVPMIVAEGEPHAPEIEALNQSNSRFFHKDDSKSLASALTEAWDQRAHWASSGQMISDTARDKYSVEAMAEGFIRTVLGQ